MAWHALLRCRIVLRETNLDELFTTFLSAPKRMSAQFSKSNAYQTGLIKRE